MAEVLVEFTTTVSSREGQMYTARACGAESDHGHWQGWLEFVPVEGGEVLRSARETTQPNRADTEYWATGLTPVYLEGALDRALHPLARPERAAAAPAAHEGPAPDFATSRAESESILNPFSVYRKGEALLRRQLTAFSPWHLVNIIRAYHLSAEDAPTLERMTPDVLIEIILTGVRDRSETPAR